MGDPTIVTTEGRPHPTRAELGLAESGLTFLGKHFRMVGRLQLRLLVRRRRERVTFVVAKQGQTGKSFPSTDQPFRTNGRQYRSLFVAFEPARRPANLQSWSECGWIGEQRLS